MSIALALVFILIGFFLLMWSADLLVDNASELAGRLGISPLLVGIIIVGFGTSAPELFVSAMAALDNKGNLALGNALGSNITNIGLVLGSAAIIRALPVGKATAKIDMPIVIATGLVAIALLFDGVLSHIDGVILLAILLGYLLWTARSSSGNEALSASELVASVHEHDVLAVTHPKGKSVMTASIYAIISIALLILASRILVKGAVTVAEFFHVGELIIGLTIVAIGTSLPELAAAIAAARKGVHDMIIGNIIGSNVFNTLGVLGLTGALRATEIDTGALWRDFPIMLLFTGLMLVFALTKYTISRLEGSVLVAAYIAYLGYLISVTV
ncbi:calcium/sodium antiporter [Arenicella xantha]|uniref:Cation:H+ antiporter n=1 Tax=Arenicella xantha TaxID=644221 RepID=A0A395JL11_9GAMM|nr:calcium/sodium antiporter [Arenicella xantha]RBP49658.1 cation:H+ antiporter [Arenicella xantha]